MHDVLDFQQQAAAQRAARVREGEIFSSEPTSLEQRDSQGIAEHQAGSGGGGRREVQRAGFDGDASVQIHRSGLGQYRVGVAGHADQGDAEPLDQR